MPSSFEAGQRHAAYYTTLLASLSNLYDQGHEAAQLALTSFALDWGNIAAGQRWTEDQADHRDAAAALCSMFALWGANLLFARQPAPERIRWLRSALKAALRMQDWNAAAAHLMNLGIASADAGELQHATEYYAEALSLIRQLGDRQAEGNVLNSLGHVLTALGEYRRAIECHEQHLVIAHEIGARRGEAKYLTKNNLNSLWYT